MKRTLSLLFAFALMIAMFTMCAFALNLNESNIITPGIPVTSNIIELDPEDTHLFELKESGTVSISINSSVPYFTLGVYNAAGDKIWNEDAKCNGKVYTKELELTSGSYFLNVSVYNKKYGAYNLMVNFKPSGESNFENQGGSNNTIVDAVNYVLEVNKSYVSHLALNDYDDYFKIELPNAGTISLDIESSVATARAEFFDGNSSKAWTQDVKFEGGKYNTDVSLNAGTYYFHLQRIGGNYGAFKFSFKFESANEYSVEAVGGSNNKIAVASPVELNRDIGGLIAYNDLDDYYVLNLEEAGTVNVQLTSNVDSFKVEFLDADGKKNFFARDEVASCNGFTFYKSLDLTAGTYYFHIFRNKDFYGVYNLNFNYVPSNESIVEKQGGSNNTMEEANDINTNALYFGNIGINDISDYYCFSTSTIDTVTLTLNSNVAGFTVRILDAKGTRLLNEDAVCNGRTYSKTLSLTKGIYYLNISRCNDYTGTYSFNISASSKGLNQKYTSFGSTVSTWALTEIEEAYNTNLIPTYLLGTDLTDKINRAEFAAIAVSLYEYISNSRVYLGKNPFYDISSNRFVNEIIKASNLGITAGTSDTTFSPNNLITREQMATMMCRAYKKKKFPAWTVDNDSEYPLKAEGAAKFQDDKQIASYAREAVYFMAANNIINGVDDAGVIFAPSNIATREQAIIIALRCAKNLK